MLPYRPTGLDGDPYDAAFFRRRSGEPAGPPRPRPQGLSTALHELAAHFEGKTMPKPNDFTLPPIEMTASSATPLPTALEDSSDEAWNEWDRLVEGLPAPEMSEAVSVRGELDEPLVRTFEPSGFDVPVPERGGVR